MQGDSRLVTGANLAKSLATVTLNFRPETQTEKEAALPIGRQFLHHGSIRIPPVFSVAAARTGLRQRRLHLARGQVRHQEKEKRIRGDMQVEVH
jgi:hypothetical protein